jgi:hypothetical protein
MSSFIIFVAKCLSAQYRRRLSHAALHERLGNAIYPLELEIKVTTRTGIDGKLYTPLDVWIVTCPSPNSVRTVRDYINRCARQLHGLVLQEGGSDSPDGKPRGTQIVSQ